MGKCVQRQVAPGLGNQLESLKKSLKCLKLHQLMPARTLLSLYVLFIIRGVISAFSGEEVRAKRAYRKKLK